MGAGSAVQGVVQVWTGCWVQLISLASLTHPAQWSHWLGKKASLNLPLYLEEQDQGLEGSRVFLPHETPFLLFNIFTEA